MKTPDYIPKTLPLWTKVIARDALLTTKDMAQIFGCSESVIHERLARGTLMQPTMKRLQSLSGNITRNFWRMSDVRQFIRDANRCVSAEKDTAS